jgi:hypothetical protein
MSQEEREQSSLNSQVCLFGVFTLPSVPRALSLIKLTQPMNLWQIRILRRGLSIDIKEQGIFTSQTEPDEIDDICFFGTNLQQHNASKLELISRIPRLDKLISKDCIIPLQKPVV